MGRRAPRKRRFFFAKLFSLRLRTQRKKRQTTRARTVPPARFPIELRKKVLGDLPPALEECPYSRADLLAAIDASGEDDPFARSTYLGTYHGCIVFVSKNLWDEYGNGLVAGVAYDRGQDAFWVVRNDETCTLDKAFQRGYLTVDDIRTIMYYRYGERVPQR